MGDGDSPLLLPHPTSQSSSSGRHHYQPHHQHPRVPTMATSSATATTAAASPVAAAPADERTSSSVSASNSSSSSTTTSVLFSDASGKPLFPALHKLRVEGQQLMRESSQQVAATLQEQDDKWKVSEQVSSTLAKSQATLSKSHATLQSKVRTLQTAAQIQQQLRQTVLTKYGAGRVVSYNETTATFSVQLSFGTLYTPRLPLQETRRKSSTRTTSRRRRKHTTKAAPTNLELNSAYESWEKARRGQVQAECQRVGLRFTEDTMQQCLSCLVQHHVETQKAAAEAARAAPVVPAAPTLAGADGKPLFPFLFKMRQTGQDKLREANQQYRQHRTQTQKCTPCLLCAATVCATHSSAAFRQQVGITVCGTCVEHLEFDYFVDNTTTTDAGGMRLRPEQLQQETQHLQDLYRRTHLLLAYSAQFMLGTANALEENKKSHHKIGVGGSSAGLVSGVLGVAAACSILTPAGPPLLIASLVFGGSATAVQTGSEAINYYSEPNQFANRILTLQAISEQILQTVRQMRETTLLPYLDKAILKLEKCLGSSSENAIFHGKNGNLSKDGNAAAVVSTTTATRAGARMGSSAATATSAAASVAMQEAALTGRFVSRATTAAARTARLARFAGGALSAATLVMEAHELRHTVDQIHKGSPCEKAQALRTIYANYQNHKMMPSTKYVEKMCQSYAKVRSKELFVQAMSMSSNVSDVSSSENEQVGAAAVVDFDGRNDEEDDLLLAEEVVSNLESAQREDDDDSSVSSSSCSEVSSSTITMSSSQQQQSLSSSSSPHPSSSSLMAAPSAAAAAATRPFSSLSSKASLLERVKRFKARESMRAQQAELALTE